MLEQRALADARLAVHHHDGSVVSRNITQQPGDHL